MRAPTRIVLAFALASFLCSALIFWIEPLVGKQLLPLVGGAPGVWNVCLLFFQTALLGGYAFAHGLTRMASARRQAVVYLAVAVFSFLLLPIQFNTTPGDPSHPTAWLLLQLFLGLFLPFVSLAAAAPLLQHWYSRTTSGSARDPYFLYAASNTGSLLALLSFPILIEPHLHIHTQNRIWSILFVIAVLVCAAASLASNAQRSVAEVPAAPLEVIPSDIDELRTVLREESRADILRKTGVPLRSLFMWVLLAAIPSSLLMGVTTFLTSDVAPVPLLWVIPLAIYLLTFILAFGWLRAGVPAWFYSATVILALTWCILFRMRATNPLWLLVGVHLIVFAVLALGAHARLAASRPAPAHLTTFYLAIAVGGAIGGVFNALIAPVLFNSYLEYPLVVLAAVLLNLKGRRETPSPWRDVILVMAVGIAIAGVLAFVLPPAPVHTILAVGIPTLFAYVLSDRSLRFVGALAVVLVMPHTSRTLDGFVLRSERNFYGVLHITTDADMQYHELRHGNTLHGASDTRTPGGSEPLTYYWTGSPVADVIRDMQTRRDSLNVAVVGLGVGALAWYGEPGEHWTYYEINPAVIAIARDTSWFSFIARSKADNIAIIAGDARFKLHDAPDGSYDLIVLDAFTSDAIPLHLLTLEAVQLYSRKLRPGGLLVFHISNRYLDLAPTIAAIGHAVGREAFLGEFQVTADQLVRRIESSDWIVLAGTAADFPIGTAPGRWQRVSGAGTPVWTDDYSNIWTAFAH